MKTPAVVPFDANLFSAWFESLSAIGATPEGGVNRPFGSKEDRQVRAWLLQVANQERLTTSVDAIGNIWGTRAGTEPLPAIVIGSHHDSVPYGGRFDGPLGVLIALSVIAAITKAGISTRHPLTFVSFTAEEPNPFGLSTLGSRTVAGRLTPDVLWQTQSSDGTVLQDAVRAVGGDLNQVLQARRSDQDIAAFLELHIEQGLRLIRSSTPIGVVTGICGIYRERVVITGQANHAGTTLLPDRHDALLAGAQVALAVESAVAALGKDDVIGTVGTFRIEPGAINVIPGMCELVLELRTGHREDLDALRADLDARFAAIAQSRGITLVRSVLLDQAAQPLDAFLQETLQTSARNLDIPYRDLFSMAGHDATHMASLTRAAMLFVPSVGGKSHCPEEFTPLEDICRAAQVLIHSVLALDENLDRQDGIS
ncbi:MAG: Zn-dependent hydrolase [Firmicutes bacterium]|nr:Zn-dependent hydrolase [Bacillota bacterium]